jgi:carotenoid cleavage dioxygenase-like enzyme
MRFPKTILSVSRQELNDLELNIKDGLTENPGSLPQELHGHVFIVSPVGSIASATVQNDPTQTVVLPSQNGWTPFYNGDGMIYRLSFTDAKAKLSSKLVKTPCFYADKATHQQPKLYEDLAFSDVGISRISKSKLGMRNQLNTAFVPVKFPGDIGERLLVTWDVGRPYEIDPETLETLNPIGINNEWSELTPLVPAQPFKRIMSSAHPVYDPKTQEFFTVNIGKSIATLMGFARALKKRLSEQQEALKMTIGNSLLGVEFQKQILEWYGRILRLTQKGNNLYEKFNSIYQSFAGNDYVHLIKWDGKQVNIAGKWNLVLPDGSPVKVNQTFHQMGLTKDYLILVDTAFKLAVENFLPYDSNIIANDSNILLADFLDYPQLPFAKIYIIKRSDLTKARSTPFGFKRWRKLPQVTVKEVQIDLEFSHYVVDYDNPNDRITIHCSHLCASDPAESIRIFDRSTFDDRDDDNKFDDPQLSSRVQDLAGAIVGAMDVNRLATWVIDGKTGEIFAHEEYVDRNLTWATQLYACIDNQPTEQFNDLYWNNWGCRADILTKRIVNTYRDYPNRLVDIEEVRKLTYQGIPSNICHLTIDRSQLESDKKIQLNVSDKYCFPNGYLGTSIQFVPRFNPKDGTDGYIVCVVLTSDELLSNNPNKPDWSQNSELWVFDAQKLTQGPLCRLSHPLLNFGFTVHTTWLAEAKSPSKLNYDVKTDHDYLIAMQPADVRDKIRNLFDREIYPNINK